MRVQEVNKISPFYKKLQDFVSTHNLLFNSASWLKNYSEKNIHQCVILNNNDDVIGCFNYYIFKKAMFKFLITPPFSPDIDLFYVNPAESVVGKNSFNKELITSLANYFEELKIPYVNINLPAGIVDTQPFIWKEYISRSRYSYLINLSLTQETLWNNLSSEKRKSINKAMKDNIQVVQTKDMDIVYSLVLKSLERNEIAKNRNVIKNILFSFADSSNSFAFVAQKDGIAIGAAFCVISKKKAMYLFGGFDSENKHHGAGVSCMWQSILKAKELGLQFFDFEGSMNPDIERYFREFGGELISYFSVQKIKPALKAVLALKKHNPV